MKKLSENKKTALLQKWLAGDISFQEEKLLRGWALEDPFLAEAMEGYQALPEAAHPDQLQQLRTKLGGKYPTKKKNKVVAFPLRFAAAASVAIVLAGMMWIWISPGSNALSEMSTEEAASQASAPIAAINEEIETGEADKGIVEEEEKDLENTLAQSDEAVLLPTEQSPASNKTTAVTTTKPSLAVKKENNPPRAKKEESFENIEAADFAVVSEEAPVVQESLPPEITSADIESNADETKEEVLAGVAAAPARSPAPITKASVERSEVNVAELQQIIGYVYDDQGLPLIGANVAIEGTLYGTTTDAMGRFNLQFNKTTPNLKVDYIGYASQVVPIEKLDSISVILDSDAAALSEVQIVDQRRFSKAKRSNSTASREMAKEEKSPLLIVDKNSAARPRGGFDKFENYILQNLRYPEAAKVNGIKGQVILEFSIDDAGTPATFKILRSLGFGCDDEAIRLLKEGPKWRKRSSYNGQLLNVSIGF